MKQVLKQFINDNLFVASNSLLNQLNIKHTQEEPTPMRFEDYYDSEIPQYIEKTLLLAKEYFYIGEVCDDAIKNIDNVSSQLREDLEKLQANAHYKSMMLFAVDLQPSAHVTRSDMAMLTRAFNKLVYNFPVTVIFRQGSLLSFGTCERTEFKQEWRQGQGEKLGKVSLLRNIDCQYPHRGHLDILKGMDCASCATFDKLYEQWQKVFNSELLTKQFYNDLFDWYQWAVSPESNVTFPEKTDTAEDDRQDIETKIIRLITRLMFVWFIKQKGLVPDSIFNTDYLSSILKDFDPQSTTDSNYYQAILQNLFFATLNRPIIEDGEGRGFAKIKGHRDVKNLYRYEDQFSISEEEVIHLFSCVPFLNCGLFDCLDRTTKINGVDAEIYTDGFSRNPAKFSNGSYKYRAFIPNNLFFDEDKGIISIFERYVFTIEENTPQDVQVALDPELLGKVFENLLGAYNPETKETARNESGSFYTPREIVQYMVNESLVAHLKQNVDEKLETQYRQLLDFTTEEIDLTQEQKSKILHSLFTCKILDPACGSGAFPMGMLQQMVHILQQVDPDNSQWRDVLSNMAVDESRRAFGIIDEEERKKKLLEIEETFNNGLNSPDYTRKLYIIESCIYGVDIQPIAMLITRLRFFITLICEQTDIQRDKPEINFGIKTLPNLESKFVAANSLINAEIHKYNEDWTNDEVLSLLKNELLAIRRRHFYTRKRSKKISLLREDEHKRKEIHNHINRLVGEPNKEKIKILQAKIEENTKLLDLYQGEDWVEETVQADLFSDPEVIRVDKNKRERDRINGVIAACKRDIEHENNKSIPQGFEAAVLQVTDWNPYDQNTVSPFLDIEWMFGVTDGFDIVIGNPPYRQLQDNGGELANLYNTCGYETFARMGDIYCLFYERGVQLIKEKGALCYITSNKWMRTGYGEKTRAFLAQQSNPILLIDFAGIKVFDSATVDTNIILLIKDQNQHSTKSVLTSKQNKDKIHELNEFVENEYHICNFSSSEVWIILSSIEQNIKEKINLTGTQLKDWNIKINFGIKTGNNDAFLISSLEREYILSNCSSDEERKRTSDIIKPLIRGRDIQKYSYDWADIWIISLFPSRNYNIEQYPAVKKHLLGFAKNQLIDSGNGWVAENYLESFCYQKLAQIGNIVEIEGKRIYIKNTPERTRKRTNNKWFETQDPISYWENISLPKIIWKRIGSILRFSYDDKGALGLDSTCFATGEHIGYLCCVLNSKMGHYLLKDSPKTGTGDLLVSVQAIEPIKVPYNKEIEVTLTKYLHSQIDNYSEEIENKIDNLVFSLYNLSDEEINYISEFTKQFE